MNLDYILKEFLFLKREYKILGGLLCVVVIGLLVWFLGVAPSYELTRETTQKQEELRKQLQELKAKTEGSQDFAKRVEKTKSVLRKASEQLPTGAEIAELLEKIDVLAKETGLLVDLFKKIPEVNIPSDPKDPKSPVELAEVRVEVKIQGSFHELAIFFNRLAKMKRIINVDGLKMQVIQQKVRGDITRLIASFNLRTYRFLTDEELKALAPPPAKKAKKGAKK